ncbi:DNA methyltransferase [Zhengella mangrovi]|uniref:Site-specific DNA-methyltransferase (adenine-specific) n=2 Tax=Zhengella mangrovi TaxID=1982044 RepID=A0A2G1QPG9_9HYPH|nr:DNA methyltransferase [Zhengella mangrovi]
MPFLKWAGGKRWLFPELQKHLPERFGKYFEPFLGGGSIFFALQPERAVLSDLNADLVELYQALRDDPDGILKLLKVHHQNHSKNHYYDVRANVPKTSLERAARTLYLNRTCFNGLYRVNKRGDFNVPIGTKTSVVFPDETFAECSAALKCADIRVSDFEPVIDEAARGDLVYVDPPYTVAHNMNGFVKYNDNIFSWADQLRLRDAIARAVERGAMVLVSNANHESIKELYDGQGQQIEVSRYSVISGPASHRKQTTELLIKFNLAV